MIISPGRGYVFVHIPKTGGTALSLALEARAMADDILIGDTPKARARRRRLKGAKTAGRLWKHSRLDDIVGLVSANEISRLRVFTLVRNPWDRVVSYYHWLRVQQFDHPAVTLARTTDFEGFLRAPLTVATLGAETFGSYVTLNGTERPADFVRLEHFKDDIAPVERHLGFALTPLERSNASNRHRDFRRYYSDETARLVANYCARDIRRFGYEFDAPAA